MPPRPTPTEDRACALHEQRLEQLDDQCSSLRREQRQTHDAVAELRTEVALLRVAIEGNTRELERSREKHEGDRERQLERLLPPGRAAWALAIGVFLLGIAGAWIGKQLPNLPGTQAAQAATTQH